MTNGPGIAGASAVVSADLAGEVYVVMAGQGSGTLAVFRAGTARWPWIWRWGRTSPRGRSRGFWPPMAQVLAATFDQNAQVAAADIEIF